MSRRQIVVLVVVYGVASTIMYLAHPGFANPSRIIGSMFFASFAPLCIYCIAYELEDKAAAREKTP